VVLLKGAGLRVDVEALDWNALSLHPSPSGSLLEVTGKGGHTRFIPVGPEVEALVKDTPRLIAVRKLSYDGHLKRWNRGKAELGLPKEATPHAVRHWYATTAYRRSGKDLRAVQELLGHADVSTTAGYVGADMEGLRNAAGC
jgi:integrase/recombinase XerC